MERVYVAFKILWNSPISTVGYVRALPWWTGILAGMIGAFAPFLSSMLGRIFLGTSPSGDLAATLYLFPFTAVFFLAFTLVQGVLGLLFGGKLKLLSFMANMGWAWFPLVLVSACLTLLIWAASRFSSASGFSAADLTALIAFLGIVVTAVWTVRFQYGVLKDSMGLSRAKAVLVYVLTGIPGFLIFDLIDVIA